VYLGKGYGYCGTVIILKCCHRIVVNYDFPTGVEDYVHRIGRTGRAGATGSAYTFFSDQDAKYASDLVKILEGADQSVPSQLKEMALRGGYGGGGRSRRWASSDDSYGGRGYGSGYAKRSTDSFNNSSFGNQAVGGSSFHSRCVSFSIQVISFWNEY
jgi:ATP-dependent RNA helicase DDX5/DBP2